MEVTLKESLFLKPDGADKKRVNAPLVRMCPPEMHASNSCVCGVKTPASAIRLLCLITFHHPVSASSYLEGGDLVLLRRGPHDVP